MADHQMGMISAATIESNKGLFVFPSWAPEPVQHYLAHTGAGISIRDLARMTSCHASTMLRRIQRIEQKRDDPLVDAALRRIETRLNTKDPLLKRHVKKELTAMTSSVCERPLVEELDHFQKESMRILRRLCETGAVLAIAKDMDMAVVLREGPEGAATRTAVVEQEIAQAIALRGWIETESKGRILRYRITSAGREEVKDLLGRFPFADGPVAGGEFAEARATFEVATSAQPDDAISSASHVKRTRYNLAESPLTALSRRKGKGGAPFLSDELVRSGERLREDFELAQMGAKSGQNWDDYLADYLDQPRSKTDEDHGAGPEAAKTRVIAALRDLGPGLSDVVLRCCCYLEGLESAEKHLGWSARSGKIVLRIALQRLQRHYANVAEAEGPLIG